MTGGGGGGGGIPISYFIRLAIGKYATTAKATRQDSLQISK